MVETSPGRITYLISLGGTLKSSLYVCPKFILTYDEAYWLDSGFSGDFLSNGGLQTKAQMEGSTPVTLLMDGTTSDGVPTLVGYLGKSSCKNKILT